MLLLFVLLPVYTFMLSLQLQHLCIPTFLHFDLLLIYFNIIPLFSTSVNCLIVKSFICDRVIFDSLLNANENPPTSGQNAQAQVFCIRGCSSIYTVQYFQVPSLNPFVKGFIRKTGGSVSAETHRSVPVLPADLVLWQCPFPRTHPGRAACPTGTWQRLCPSTLCVSFSLTNVSHGCRCRSLPEG